MWRSKTRSAMVVACLLLSGIQVGPSQAGTAEASSLRDNPALLQATPDAHPEGTNGIEVLWRVATADTFGLFDPPPLVAQGTVYVESAENLHALDAATGMERWRFKIEHIFPASPEVVDGVVYIGSLDGNVYALDARTGTEQWRFEALTTSPPMVVDGVVYIGSSDGSVYALDAGTGTERWRFTTGADIVSSPVVADGVVCVGSTDGIVYTLDAATGAERWRFTTGAEDFFASIVSSPVVAGGVVYVGSTDGNVYALDAALGTERWRFTSSIYSSPVVADGVVYVGSTDGNVYALDAALGTERWRFTTGRADFFASIVSSPVVAGGVVYVGSTDGNLVALDAASGTEQWHFEAVGPVTTPPVVVDDVVYVGDFDGNVYALDAATGAEQWRLKIEDYASTSMTVVDDVVYFGSSDSNVYALGVRPLTLEAGGQAVVTRDGSVLRGAPAVSGVERATLTKATAVTLTGEAVHTGNLTWWPVTVDDTGDLGWIVADDLEPTANRPSATPLVAATEESPEDATEAPNELIVQPINGTVIDAEDNDGDSGDDNSGSGSDSGEDLGIAPEVSSLASIPGDPGGRLHIDQNGQLSFSGTPSSVTFERDGLALEPRNVDTGGSVFVCDNSGNCIDATSASADGFHTDYPLGWLGSEFIYERIGEDGEVSFRAVQLAEGSLEVIEDRVIASGGSGLETLTRSYPVEGGLLVPASDAWLLISTEGVSQIDDNPYGGDISRIRTAPAANTIAYVAQGQIVIASLSSPGTPEAVIPFTGNEYALAPDGSRVAVTDGSTIQILDRTGRVVESFANEAGVSIGSIAWGNDGIVFVDQSNGVLRVIQP